MSNSRKITEEDYRELIFMKGRLFNIENGELNPFNYEILESKIAYLEREELNVSEFRDFLERYRIVYDIRKQDSIS